jgi:hypothetical protein
VADPADQTKAIQGTSKRALRLSFTFDRADVELVSLRALEMRAPPSSPLGEGGLLESVRGAWIELRDSRGQCLWRRILHDPFRTQVETPREGGGFTNVYREHPRGSLVVLIPDLPEAGSVVLFSSPLERERCHEPAREVAAFRLPIRR